MRLSLISPRSSIDAAPATQRLSTSTTPSSFADRLTAKASSEVKPSILETMNAKLDEGSLAQTEVAALRERIKEYLAQIELMQSLMMNPGPMPSLDQYSY